MDNPEPTHAALDAADQVSLDGSVRYVQDSDQDHVESFFVKLNDPYGPSALWARFTIHVGIDGPLVETWAVVFDKETGKHFAAREIHPIGRTAFGRDRMRVRVEKCRLESDWTRGTIQAQAGHELGWDLRFESQAPPFRLLPKDEMYEPGRFPSSKSLTPIPDARFSGEIYINDTVIEVEDWPGMVGHNWGRKHAHRYAWGQCNAFDDAPGSWFEGISAKVKLGPLPLPFMTLLYVHHDGVGYDFRARRHWLNRSVKVGLYRWGFRARSDVAHLEGELSAAMRDLVGLRYRDPKGPTADCLNSKVALIKLKLTRPDGKEIATLQSAGRAALELLVRGVDHKVAIRC